MIVRGTSSINMALLTELSRSLIPPDTARNSVPAWRVVRLLFGRRRLQLRRPRRGGRITLFWDLNFITVAQPEVGGGAGIRAIHDPLMLLPAGRVPASDLDVPKVRGG